MILRGMRWMAQLDRSYFLAISAFIASIIAAIFLSFAPIAEKDDGSTITLIQESGAVIIVLFVLPVMVLSAPLIALPREPGTREKNDKINSVASSGVLLAYAAAFATSFGLFFVPALILTIASSASLFFGPNRKAPVISVDGDGVPINKLDENGVRISRSALRRARQKAAGQVPPVKSETPLASSRRRKGKRRRPRKS